jgi:RNA polymerase sigma-70 factor (ECF subfamily)
VQTKFDQYTDAELLDLYQKDADERLLGYLISRYAMLVFGVCLKYLKNTEDAKDASQHIFEKVILEIGKYPIPYFKSWLYSVAKNHCLMYLRSVQTKFKMSERSLDGIELHDDSDSEVNLKEWLHEGNMQKLRDAIANLNPEQSTCIDLFYFKKLSYKEIEEKTGMNFQQVKSHVQNGKRNLKVQLKTHHFNHEK